MENKRKRGPRTTNQQYEIYVEFLREHEEFRMGKLTPQNCDKINLLWSDLTKKLNSCGHGAVKATDEWKRVSLIYFVSIISYFL